MHHLRAKVRGFGPEAGRASKIWRQKLPGYQDLALKKLGFENLAPKAARIRRFCPERGQGSRILCRKKQGFEDLAPKAVRNCPGSLFGALWAYFVAWAQKFLQEACLKLSKQIF